MSDGPDVTVSEPGPPEKPGPPELPVPDGPPAPGASIARSTLLALEADIATALSTFVTAIIVARALGPTNRGIYFLATLAASIIVLFGNLGMDAAAMVYGAKGRIPAAQLHGLALSFSIAVGALGAALLLGLEHVWVTSVLRGMSWTTAVLVAVSIAPLLYAQVMGAMLTGMGYVPAISVMRIGLSIATPAVTIPAVVIYGNAASAVAAWLIITVAFAFLLCWYASRRIARPARPTTQALRQTVSYSLRVYLGSLAAQGFLRIDFFFVSAYMGPRAVGLYSQASVMAERMTTFGQAVYSSSAQRLGADPPREAAQLAASLVRLLLLVMVPVAVVLAVFARPIIVLLYGARFGAAGEPFAILLPGTVCLTLWNIVALYVMSTLHRPGATTLIQGAALLCAVPLYWFAVHQWGFNGAAAVSTLVYLGVFAAGLAFLVRSPYVGWRDLVPTHRDVRVVAATMGRGVAWIRSRRARTG